MKRIELSRLAWLMLLLAAWFAAMSLLSSCSKPKKQCYYCTFGPQVQPKQVCIEDWQRIEDVQFVDQNGNDLTSYCEKQ